MTITLRTILADDARALGYNSSPLLTWHGDEDDRPTGGETVHYGWSGLIRVTRDYRHHVAGNLSTLDGATHITVPATTWGDYIGDDYQRSNARSLVRDFPGVFVTVVGDYSSEWLALDLDAPREDEDASQLCELLRGLADEYPIYDESDHSELVDEMSREDWQEWAGDDAERTYRDALLAAGLPDDESTDDEIAERANLTARVGEWMSDGTVTYEAESAVSGIFRGLEDALRTLAAERAATILADH